MATWRDCKQLLLPLLLSLLLPSASAQALSYQDAVRRAVDGLNQRSADPNLFRLLSLESEPPGDEDPQTPKPVSFTVKETVCPKMTQLQLEQCDFKEHGLVKRCSGTVTLDPGSSALDIRCKKVQRFRRMAMMAGFFRKARKKLSKALRKAGRQLRKGLGRLKPSYQYQYRF